VSTHLFKSTVVIWTAFDPTDVDLTDLAWEATEGQAYASHQDVAKVEVATTTDPHLTSGALSFFDPNATDSSPAEDAPLGAAVRATLTADGSIDGVTFDATAWFETASPAELRDLIECGFGGDYPADAVARHFHGMHEEVTKTLDACDDSGTGYEVHVEKVEAVAWLAMHRADSLGQTGTNA
jgi:hypothetical protein